MNLDRVELRRGRRPLDAFLEIGEHLVNRKTSCHYRLLVIRTIFFKINGRCEKRCKEIQ